VIDLKTLPRLPRAGWTALTAVLAAWILTGMWNTLKPDAGDLTRALEASTEDQVGVWTVAIFLMLGGVWAVSAMLVRNAAGLVHAGVLLMWDVPFVVTALGLGGFLVAIAAPFSGFTFQALATAVMLSALGKWIDGAVTEHRSRATEPATR
jgi:hypothetical protein